MTNLIYFTLYSTISFNAFRQKKSALLLCSVHLDVERYAFRHGMVSLAFCRVRFV